MPQSDLRRKKLRATAALPMRLADNGVDPPAMRP
jgi:hypothetical protein